MKLITLCLLCGFTVLNTSLECSSSLLKSKVVNGKEVKDGQFKFLASLRLYKKHFCGGTLITRKYVVTAGRCVSFIRSNAKPNLEAAGVLLGTNDLIKDGKIYGIKNLEHSNKFDPSNPITTSGYDIGLILLDKWVMVTNKVRPTKVTIRTIQYNMVLDTAGWGREEIDDINVPLREMRMSNILKKIRVKINYPNACRDIFTGIDIQESHICGRVLGNGLLTRGDIGSPLIYSQNQLMGIVIEVNLPSPHFPALFLNFSVFRSYIEEAKIRLINPDN